MPMPAHLRYKGSHVQIAKTIADKENMDLVILSGKYGIVSGEEKIPYYDYLLTEEDVSELVDKVKRQLRALEVTELDFYAERREGNWIPYYEVIEGATQQLNVKLKVIIIEGQK